MQRRNWMTSNRKLADPRIYHDEGAGVTAESIKFFKRLKGKFGTVLDIHINQNRQYTMEIVGTHSICLLSGVNCGYGGTGPHGTLQILEMIGVKVAEDYIFENTECHMNLHNKVITW